MDYCTAFPDGWPRWLNGTGTEWQHCCKVHDDFYAQQTTLDLVAYFGAHYDLASCVAVTSPLLAGVMLGGVSVLGLPFIISRHNRAGRIRQG